MSDQVLPESVKEEIFGVLREIRVPDLPYPVGSDSQSADQDWAGLLRDSWQHQSDQQVIRLLADREGPWSVVQVNAAYLSDRIMDVFLRASGLHPVLVTRLARLRYPLAWRLEQEDPQFIGVLVSWLDGFADWRGWSDSGGRSSRALLDQLDRLVEEVDACFAAGSIEPFCDFCDKWQADAQRRQTHSSRLHQRLLETETGVARQRRADQVSRAVVGRALSGRRLPPATLRFIVEHWLRLLREVAWKDGAEGELWRHANRMLEWMVWAGDPQMSGTNLDRLYQVGEQLSDRVAEVWQRVWGEAPPQGALHAMESVLVERLRGGSPDTVSTSEQLSNLDYQVDWLDLPEPPAGEIEGSQEQWFVEGSGSSEQRRFFLAYLRDTAEILWSNGYGVRLGLTPWREFERARQHGDIRPLPALNHFGDVLKETVAALGRVLASQRLKRQEAAKKAREKAERLRQQQAEEARRREQEEQTRKAEAEERARQAQQKAEQEEAERLEAVREAAYEQALAAVDKLNMGSWIAVRSSTDPEQEQRLKLAVRINASRKLVFVDRLGLNRTELTIDSLVERVLDGEARILGSTAEFDETLSRVVGRIRVGR